MKRREKERVFARKTDKVRRGRKEGWVTEGVRGGQAPRRQS